MQTVVTKQLAAVEKKLAELSELGEHVKKLKQDFAGLSKRLDARKEWRNAVGALANTKVSREADAMGSRIRRNQTKP